jgi:NifU-like protein involved in Fe-S cluster formation
VPAALYNRDILRLAAAIPHQGRLSGPHASADKSSPVCGSRVTVDVVLDSSGRISALGQEVNACALGQASAALFGAEALGTTVLEIAAARDSLSAYLKGESEEPGTWPGLSILGVARPFAARHASILLPFEAAAEAAARAAKADAA